MADITDFSADASLTDDQRRLWESLCGELSSVRAKNRDLVDRLRQYEWLGEDFQSAVLNHDDFYREGARMRAYDERYGGTTSILYFDFECLEEATAHMGDAFGKAVLREICTVMTQSLRKSDIVGRLAPDEFGVLLLRCENAKALSKAEKLLESLQQALSAMGDYKPCIKIGYGAYTFREGDNFPVGLKEAEQAMIKAKERL